MQVTAKPTARQARSSGRHKAPYDGVKNRTWTSRSTNAPLPLKAVWAACNKLVVINLCLLLLTMFSALAVIYTKHSTRQLNTRLQQLANHRDTLQAEWTQLMLEQGTWAMNARVEEIAAKHLNMVSPPPQAMQPLVVPAQN